MAVEREQRIKEDTSTAKRNLYCEVGTRLLWPPNVLDNPAVPILC